MYKKLMLIIILSIELILIIILSSGLIAYFQNFYNKKLMEAIGNNNIKQVSSILEKQKANINYISESEDEYYRGMTPLTLASSYGGNLEMVKLLVENGADINAKNHYSKTALMIASEYNDIETVKYLVENGADVNAKNEDGKTAIDFIGNYFSQIFIGDNSRSQNKIEEEIRKVLLEAGAK